MAADLDRILREELERLKKELEDIRQKAIRETERILEEARRAAGR